MQVMQLLQLVLGLMLISINESTDVNIKIVDAPHPNRNHPSVSQQEKKLQLRGPPAPMSGPPHLQVLAGDCFEIRYRNYLYNVCPFHNVTQKEETAMWNRFHGVLGVWREWIIEEDRFVGMLYSFGEKCGRTDREARIMFKCSTLTKLANITEPKTCKYTIWMWTPLACFKGAMQVYRVLSNDEISQWDKFNTEYHSGLITRQGLLKRRKQLLLSVGLYYNFTKDEVLRNEENNIKNNPPTTTATKIDNKDNSRDCQLRVSELEKELNTTKLQLTNYQNVLSQLEPSIQQQFKALLKMINVTRQHVNHTQSPSTSEPLNHQPVDQPLNHQPVDQPLNHQPVDQPLNNDDQPLDVQPEVNQGQPPVVAVPQPIINTVQRTGPRQLDQPNVANVNDLQIKELEPDD